MSHSTTVTIKTFLNNQTLTIELPSRTVSEMFGVKVHETRTILNGDAQEALQSMMHRGMIGYDNIALLALMVQLTYQDVNDYADDYKLPLYEQKFAHNQQALIVEITHFD